MTKKLTISVTDDDYTYIKKSNIKVSKLLREILRQCRIYETEYKTTETTNE